MFGDTEYQNLVTKFPILTELLGDRTDFGWRGVFGGCCIVRHKWSKDVERSFRVTDLIPFGKQGCFDDASDTSRLSRSVVVSKRLLV